MKMVWIKKHWLGLALALAAFSAPWVINLRAQTSNPWQATVSGAHTLCAPVSPLGQGTYCFASDGLWVSQNGAAYVQLGAAATAGVSSIAVCNAAGLVCGTPQTGAVSLSIPKTATVTVSAPQATVTLQ
jgi:hypothetical protein